MFCKNHFKIAYRQINKENIFRWTRQGSTTIPKPRFNTSLRGYSLHFKNKIFSRYNIDSIFISKRIHTLSANDQTIKETVNKANHIIERYFSNSSKTNQDEEQLYYVDNEENRETIKLYPSPKNILHNVFSLVSQEMKNNSLQLNASFKSIQDKRASKWICTYKLNWPIEIKFLAKDTTKKVASHKAALAALSWLRSENKITKDGHPVIYDREEVKRLTKETIPSVSINKNTIEAMDNMLKIYEEKMIPYIQKCNQTPSQVPVRKQLVDDEHELRINTVTKKFLGLERYSAKEKVVLPIASYKEQFIKLLRENQVIIVKGEPGCGKSTRIPQYVLEAWAREDGLLGKPGMIAVTQPRRIAAISLANRVCNERNESSGFVVGYQVRLNNNFRPTTGRVLYCTTGILLRHVQSDSSLSEFSHIILDEAHERDVNTDLLMNLMKICLKNNPDLKLIIMSATIDTDMFRKYYNDAPVIEIPGFTYPVERVFIDSFRDLDLAKTLHMCEGDAPTIIHEDVVKVIEYINNKKPEGAILCFLPGWDDIRRIEKLIPQGRDTVVFCLHSRLNDSEQFRIFSKPPPGIRKIILATNIAETSVTIDDVVYVIDTGIHKEQRFDTEKGIKCIDNHWISKASATQRSGRAGRVQPGECYHLYTQSKFETFEDYSLPEIMRTSLTKIVLDSKAFSNNMDTLEFMKSLPAPPEEEAVSRAIDELKDLELLDENQNLTSLGRTLAEFQLEPKLSKTLVNSNIFMCLSPVLDIVTLFSTDMELFSSGLVDKEVVKGIKSQFSKDSDHLALMRIFEKYLEFDDNENEFYSKKFFNDYHLIPHRMVTLKKLRKIHLDYIKNGLHDVLQFSDNFSDSDEFVKATLYSGIGNILQYRNWEIVKNRLKTKNILLTRNNHKATITPESVNYRKSKFSSNYLLYVNETRSNIRRATMIRECSVLSDLSVLLFSNRDLNISEPCDVDLSETNHVEVKISVQGTNIQFLCDKKQAEKILKCKQAIKSCYGYYVSQLTSIGERNEEVNDNWCNILQLLNDIVSSNKSQ